MLESERLEFVGCPIFEGKEAAPCRKHQLVHNTGGEKFIFRFGDGDEEELLDELIRQAEDPRTSFDWFDAAVLSLGIKMRLEIEGILHGEIE